MKQNKVAVPLQTRSRQTGRIRDQAVYGLVHETVQEIGEHSEVSLAQSLLLREDVLLVKDGEQVEDQTGQDKEHIENGVREGFVLVQNLDELATTALGTES
jgi:hypothetical protein